MHTRMQAVKQQRDIVFDSTLSWLPFALQTLEFIRDWANHHDYVQAHCSPVACPPHA